jgi:trimethylamine--corrinoid protein Co-methyltransferase
MSIAPGEPFMRCDRLVHQISQFTLLSEDQKEQIHLATLEVLRRTGVRVFSQEALDLLRKAGCALSDGSLVKFPPHLIEEAIRTAPPSITTYDRNGQPALFLESTNVYYGTGSDLPNVIDLHTNQRRPALKSDIANAAKVCDALPNIDFIMSMALPSDVPVVTSDLHSFEAMVTNSTKPIVYTAHDRQGLSSIIDMAVTVTGDIETLRQKPFLLLYAEPSTPLQHTKEAVEKLLLVAENNLPVAYVPGSVTGASTPVTMAGALVMANAELLSGLVMAQLRRAGAPCLFGAGTGPLDMRTMVATYAAPEFMLMTSAMVEMGRYYKLPTWGFAGCSDSKVFDQQAALEGALWSLVAVLNGANLVHDVGYLESGLTCSFEMLVSMDEVIGMIKRFMGGIELSPSAIALDLIDKVGPGGDFLATDHTFEHYKTQWYPTLLDRQNYTEWENRGKLTLEQRAHRKVQEILEAHQPENLSQNVREKLAETIARAEDGGKS